MEYARGKLRILPVLFLTFDNAAQEPGYGLRLCQVVQGEVFVTGCVGIFTAAEDAPQLGGHCVVFHDLHLCACFKLFIHQRSVSQQTDTAEGRATCCAVRWVLPDVVDGELGNTSEQLNGMNE